MSGLRQAFWLWSVAVIPAMLSAVFFQVEWNREDNRVSLEEVGSWAGTQIIWVDARSREKYEAGHWPDAINLNPDEWDMQVPGFLEVWSPDARIVVYCDSEACGASEEIASGIREDFGHEAVYILDGGWRTLKEKQN